MSGWMPHFGDRVEYSEHGLKSLNPRSGQRRGTVVGKGHSVDCVAVCWDGLKSRYSYWTGFLAPSQLGELPPTMSPVHQRIIALCNEGKPVAEIAEIVCRGSAAVYKVLRDAKLKAHTPKQTAPKCLFAWSQESCAELSRLWNRGLTCSEIADLMRVSRNAVIGKAHRMKLSPRNSPIKRAA